MKRSVRETLVKLKNVWVTAAMVTLAAGTLVGCGNRDEKDIRAAGEGMLQGWVDGDWTEISEYGTEDFLNSSKMDNFNLERSEESFYEEIGVAKDDLDESSQEAVTAYLEDFSKEFIESYEITDVSEDEDDGSGTVYATVVLAFDPDVIDTDDNEELQKLSDDYLAEHQDELVTVYTTEGEEGMYRKIYNDLIPDIMKVYREITDAADSYTEAVELTVEKQDDGAWLVSDYQEYVEDSSSAATMQ